MTYARQLLGDDRLLNSESITIDTESNKTMLGSGINAIVVRGSFNKQQIQQLECQKQQQRRQLEDSSKDTSMVAGGTGTEPELVAVKIPNRLTKISHLKAMVQEAAMVR